ncbi:methyltransferase domain-containing protein [Tribonema minus]|uniref:Methyltransferase domain-containing protein n=1 Tax=Tribonema minus TaxID=303371 RepID=A0A836CMI5_9STRA|nr:methyltransferase domain-containing protein [Tribonema minus]
MLNAMGTAARHGHGKAAAKAAVLLVLFTIVSLEVRRQQQFSEMTGPESVGQPSNTAAQSNPATCSALYEEDIQRWRRRACLRRQRTKELKLGMSATIWSWDSWEPEGGCRLEDRVGEVYWGDGPKFVCGTEYLRDKPDCLVYSIGSSTTDSFELGLLAVAPNCEVHTFDPTVSAEVMAEKSAAGHYQFHLMGLGSQQQSDANVMLDRGPLKTLQEMMQELGHVGRTIDVFKIDCEGCEWSTLQDQLMKPMRHGDLKIGQMQIEVHLAPLGKKPLPGIISFFEDADAAGLRVFHKERNHWGCDGYRCLEYAFVSAEWSRHVFHKTTCPYSVKDASQLGALHATLDCTGLDGCDAGIAEALSDRQPLMCQHITHADPYLVPLVDCTGLYMAQHDKRWTYAQVTHCSVAAEDAMLIIVKASAANAPAHHMRTWRYREFRHDGRCVAPVSRTSCAGQEASALPVVWRRHVRLQERRAPLGAAAVSSHACLQMVFARECAKHVAPKRKREADSASPPLSQD